MLHGRFERQFSGEERKGSKTSLAESQSKNHMRNHRQLIDLHRVAERKVVDQARQFIKLQVKEEAMDAMDLRAAHAVRKEKEETFHRRKTRVIAKTERNEAQIQREGMMQFKRKQAAIRRAHKKAEKADKADERVQAAEDNMEMLKDKWAHRSAVLAERHNQILQQRRVEVDGLRADLEDMQE